MEKRQSFMSQPIKSRRAFRDYLNACYDLHIILCCPILTLREVANSLAERFSWIPQSPYHQLISAAFRHLTFSNQTIFGEKNSLLFIMQKEWKNSYIHCLKVTKFLLWPTNAKEFK